MSRRDPFEADRGPGEARSPLPAPSRLLRAIVVVPARDEAVAIERCLLALRSQRGVLGEQYEVIVVLDGCVDETPNIVRALAASMPAPAIHGLELALGVGVGRARRAGMDHASERFRSLSLPDGLIATTDADTIVAPDWLAAQLRLVTEGARAIGGNVELDPLEAMTLNANTLCLHAEQAAIRLEAVRERSDGALAEHHHFSGASLALTAEAYVACGGLPARAALEDQALADTLDARSIAIHRSNAVRVWTSARRQGRAPRGLARDLGQLEWRARRSYRAGDFPLQRLLDAKQATIALVLPAREVAATIAPIAREAARLQRAGLLDQVLVVDAASTDCTAQIAQAEGVTVVQESELHPELGPAIGKGDAMWRALSVVDSDLVAFVDTDTIDFDPEFITGLLGPLVCEPEIRFVKGAFRRPFRFGDQVSDHGGGRVTELLARPLLNLHAPDLAVFDQPLAGETAAERALLERLPFSAGYGVEIALLIDAWRTAGLDAMAQVDLGVRQNRHQPLRDLSGMAYAVLVAAQTRFLGEEFADMHACERMTLPSHDGSAMGEARAVTIIERPPIATDDQPSADAAARVPWRSRGSRLDGAATGV